MVQALIRELPLGSRGRFEHRWQNFAARLLPKLSVFLDQSIRIVQCLSGEHRLRGTT